MFEQLQTVTLSLCHFTEYRSLSAHMSLHLFVFWPTFNVQVMSCKTLCHERYQCGSDDGVWAPPILDVLLNEVHDASILVTAYTFQVICETGILLLTNKNEMTCDHSVDMCHIFQKQFRVCYSADIDFK